MTPTPIEPTLMKKYALIFFIVLSTLTINAFSNSPSITIDNQSKVPAIILLKCHSMHLSRDVLQPGTKKTFTKADTGRVICIKPPLTLRTKEKCPDSFGHESFTTTTRCLIITGWHHKHGQGPGKNTCIPIIKDCS